MESQLYLQVNTYMGNFVLLYEIIYKLNQNRWKTCNFFGAL